MTRMSLVLPEPRLPDPTSVPALRWGVVGTGWIAGAFVRGVQAHTAQRVTTVAARDRGRLDAFAAEHSIPATASSVTELVASADVDVVYVATPHASHHAVALEAIAAGKHVLVEKPFALSAEQAAEMTAAAKAAGVLAMEAMWTRYLPQSDVLRQLLAAGAIGEVHTVVADFGFAAPFDPANRMWDPALGGGALLDAGVYPISFASSVLGAPVSVVARGELTSTGVDARASLLLGSASGAMALVSTSMVSSHPTRATVIGSTGRIEMGSPFFGPTSITLVAGSIGSEETTTWTDTRFEVLHDGLSYQATALASYVDAGLLESPVHPHEEIVSVLATIDAAREQVAAR
jgi:predicted dehydrogenase